MENRDDRWQSSTCGAVLRCSAVRGEERRRGEYRLRGEGLGLNSELCLYSGIFVIS